MKKETVGVMLGGTVGLSVGFALGIALKLNIITTTLGSALIILSSSVVTCQIVEGKHSQVVLQLEEETRIKLDKSRAEAKETLEIKESQLKADHKQELTQVLLEVEKLRKAYQKAYNLNQKLTTRTKQIPLLENNLKQLGEELAKSKKENQSLTEANQKWEEGFKELVEERSTQIAQIRVDERIGTEVWQDFQSHKHYTTRALELAGKMAKVVEAAKNKNAALVLKDQEAMLRFNSGLKERDESIAKFLAAASEEKNLLKAQIQRLTSQAQGELLEPVYGSHGYSIPAQIATDLCRSLWTDYKIPLELEGFTGEPTGEMIGGYGYGTNQDPLQLVALIRSQAKALTIKLGIHAITRVEKLPYAKVIRVGFRREPALKEDEIKQLLGSAEEFLAYLAKHPVRYRVIGDPGEGKTPLTAIMVGALLSSGCHVANVSNKPKTPFTLVTVSYPGGLTSLKDTDYELLPFLAYATEEEAHKSFSDAVEDYIYRTKNPQFGEQFFGLWVWDELDNTLNSSSDSQKLANQLKKILKQGGHYSMGVIASGQSVMTKQLPGFTNDDRTLFTEVILGVNKIRKYIEAYGKSKGGSDKLKQLLSNLEDIEDWLDSKNKVITDTARELRVALVADDRSPKLFFLPHFDSVKIDYQTVDNSAKLASEFKRTTGGLAVQDNLTFQSVIPSEQEIQRVRSASPDSTIGGGLDTEPNSRKPCCPSCNSDQVKPKGKDRFYCLNTNCKRKTFTRTKAVWR